MSYHIYPHKHCWNFYYKSYKYISYIISKEKKTVVSNYFALLLIQGANFVLPLITFPYLVRTLEPEKYGLVMIAQSVALFLTIIVDFGFNISATREVSNLRNNKKKLSEYYWNIILIKTILILISFLTHSLTNIAPGSEILGVPASEINEIVSPDLRRSMILFKFFDSLNL